MRFVPSTKASDSRRPKPFATLSVTLRSLRAYAAAIELKPMPFDGDPEIVEDTGCKDQGVRVVRVSTARVHWATCPKARMFRGRRDATGV